jgi:hypothetical protein
MLSLKHIVCSFLGGSLLIFASLFPLNFSDPTPNFASFLQCTGPVDLTAAASIACMHRYDKYNAK